MKRRKSIIMAILAALVVPCLIFAGTGTVTQSYTPVYSSEGPTNMATLTFAWTTTSTGTASDVTASTIKDQIAGKYVVMAVTSPDATDYPDDNYDIVVTDEDGADIMGSVLLNRDSSSTEQATPHIGALYGPRPVAGAITLTVTNAGSGKSGTTVLYLQR